MITQDYLQSILDYDPENGVFTWKTRSDARPCWNTRHAGRRAGTAHNAGYRQIGINGKPELEHRLAWVYVHGGQPPAMIDHKDADRLNNRIANLRAATASQNNANNARRTDNSTGFKGVSRKRNKFQAIVCKDNKQITAGRLFDTPEEAHAAYTLMAARHHGEFARAA